MQPSVPPRVLLCGRHEPALDEVRRLLDETGHRVRTHLITGSLPEDAGGQQLVIIEAGPGETETLQFCRKLRGHLAEAFVPLLVLTDDASPQARLASLESGADAYLLRPFVPAELLAQVRALLRIKEVHDRLAERTAEVNRINRRLQAAYQQIDQELEMAHRIQLSFLPQKLPDVPYLRFAIHYRLCGKVGGDFYDVFRLDENHVGFYVADAMGHGVPASLLTIFVKKGVRAKEIDGQQYRLLPPSEVLQRLNRDLIDQALSEHPFITMIYGLLNYKEGTLTFARAGHPHPLHVPATGSAQYWQVHGSLLGIFDTHFPTQTQRLQPGDKLLFYSDGVDSARYQGQEPGAPSLLACAEAHRGLPITEFVERLAHDLFGGDPNPDDLTLLGLEFCLPG